MTDVPDLTAARFDAALAARHITPDAADRDAAFTIARFLDDCARRLRTAALDDAMGSDGNA